MLKFLRYKNEIIRDIFDELENITYLYNDLLNLTTRNIMLDIQIKNEIDNNHNNDSDKIRNRNERNDNNHENNEGNIIQNNQDNNILITENNSFLSIYDLLNDSFKSPFLPNNVELLEQLKKYSLHKSGINKKTQQLEEYTWKNHLDLLTYEEGGRLGELNQERGGGKLTNWHTPFYGYCNDDHIHEIDNSRKEAKRVACLLCEKFETLQLVKNTLVRHIKNHHREIYSIYCPEDFSHSSSLQFDSNSDYIKIHTSISYWEILMRLIR